MEIPNIAGWSDNYEMPNIHLPAYLVYTDLKELQENPKLSRSEAWLTKFTHNLWDLEKHLEKIEGSLPHSLIALHNWIHSVKEGNASLHEILTKGRETGFENTKSVQKYIQTMLDKDKEGFQSFLSYFQRFLEQKNS